ncbi:MAG TPA: polymer-forming cytoskeletal protein [Candidatus Acidoferrum sp.]|jgi:cytoskeletal protein CcmA (bactofilin family)
MWNKEDAKTQRVPEISTGAPIPTTANSTPANAPATGSVSSRGAASISQGIRIKGEVTGSEDLFVDGQVDGKLNLANGSLTIGPNGLVKADVTAREVIVRGRVEGKIAARERVQLSSTGRVDGEVQTERLAIEDGAMLRGKVEAGRLGERNTDVRAAAASAGSKSPAALSSGSAD